MTLPPPLDIGPKEYSAKLRPDGAAGGRPKTADCLGADGRGALVEALRAAGWVPDVYILAASPSLLERLGVSRAADGLDAYIGTVQVPTAGGGQLSLL